MYVLLALVSCVLFGIGKFGIGRYRGRISAHGIVLVSATASAMTYVLFGVLTHELAFSPIDLIPALVGGACNVTGNLAFIKAAQRGKMGVVAGVGTAACVVPLMYSVLIGESLVPRAWLGLGVMATGLLLLYLQYHLYLLEPRHLRYHLYHQYHQYHLYRLYLLELLQV